MATASARIEVVNLSGGRKVTVPLRAAVACAAPSGEVTVILAHNEHLRALNARHRGIDAPTDVLSFPALPNPLGHLGDVVVSWDFAVAQARVRGVKPIEEAAMLAVHGTLHLLGMDDQTEEDREEMVRVQNSVMAKVGLPTDTGWCSLPHEESREGGPEAGGE